ncbi:MAG: phage minor tail protein L [Candidatus Binatia bacterium]
MAEDTVVKDVFDIRDETTDEIVADIQSLAPNAMIELFVLDMTSIGHGRLYFHSGTNKMRNPVIWQGNTYNYLPVEAEGWAAGSNGSLPRPKVRIVNKDGILSATVAEYNDLRWCKVVRRRTFVKYLDAINFPDGNPTANPHQHYPDDIWLIDQKTVENRYMVEWELSSPMDLQGVMLPTRQVMQNSCPWVYRGAECGYTGTNYFNAMDKPESQVVKDVCGKRLTSCELRFPQPYGVTQQGHGGGLPGLGRPSTDFALGDEPIDLSDVLIPFYPVDTVPLPFGGFPGAIQFD